MTPSYAPGDTVFATVISQKGREAFEAARTNARVMIRVGIHYRDDVQNTWRFTWAGNTYNIIDTDRSQRRDGMLWFTAESVGAI
jgi:SPP1 family predicted phage head-tail adaptor